MEQVIGIENRRRNAFVSEKKNQGNKTQIYNGNPVNDLELEQNELKDNEVYGTLY